MIEIKVGEFLRLHIENIIELCKQDYNEFLNLQDYRYSNQTFGLNPRYSLIQKLSEIKNRGIFNRYYKTNYEIDNDTYRICSQFGGNHLIQDKKASVYHGELLLFYFKEKGILQDKFVNEELKFVVGGSELEDNDNTDAETISLNKILYGPPGTGKTYNTINRALEIIDGEVPENRSAAKSRFEALQKAGQIEFVTFHQSYGYEEFVEGIKAQSIDGKISYDVVDGVLKKLSVNALYDSLLFDEIEADLTYNELYDALVEEFKRNNYLELESKEKKTIEIRAISKKDNLYCYHQGSSVKHTVGKDRLKKLYEKYNSLEELMQLNRLHEEFTKIIGGANQTVYWTILRKMLILKKEYQHININEDISYEAKAEIVRNSDKFQYKKEFKNHIIIIDEINRGNISKIFGELITLIEPSKRIGADEEIKVRLPYSNDEFGVPSNLYIIGTMNTADRSIALLDTALRRRFEFVEMMPNIKLLDFRVGGVYIAKLLQKINARVEYLYDREHTIGHAYFMELNASSSLDDLNAIMQNKIIPLLQEYFYDDWEKILLVLNDGFIEKTPQDVNTIFDTIDDEYIEDDKFLYSVKSEFKEEAYLKIYDKMSKSEEE